MILLQQSLLISAAVVFAYETKNVSSDQESLRALFHAPLRLKIKIYHKIIPKSHPNTCIYFLYLID